jgi:hypothetical protein
MSQWSLYNIDHFFSLADTIMLGTIFRRGGLVVGEETAVLQFDPMFNNPLCANASAK